MKKFIAVLCLICAVSAAGAGCKDRKAAELESFVKEEMLVAEEYLDVIKAGLGNWDRYGSDEKITESIQKITLPQTEKAIKLLKSIKPEEETNRNVINLYVNALEIYMEGQEKMLAAIEADDDKMRLKAYNLIEQADRVYNKYNNALERQLVKTRVDIKYDE